MDNNIIKQIQLSPTPEAARTILDFIYSRSADYGAHWQGQIEFHLWETLQHFNPDIPVSFGLKRITSLEINMLTECAEQAQGWWYYDETVIKEETRCIETPSGIQPYKIITMVEERFVTLNKWLPIFEEWKQQKELRKQLRQNSVSRAHSLNSNYIMTKLSRIIIDD